MGPDPRTSRERGLSASRHQQAPLPRTILYTNTGNAKRQSTLETRLEEPPLVGLLSTKGVRRKPHFELAGLH